MKKELILIVDAQEKLFSHIQDNEKLKNSLLKLVKGGILLDIDIIYTEQLPEKIGKTIPELNIELEGIQKFEKSTFSCMMNKNISKYINNQKYNKVFLAGIETHICIYQTAFDLLKLNYDVEIIVDAVSSRNKLNHKNGIGRMSVDGAKLSTVEMMLFMNQKKAEGPKFKNLIEIIK